MKILISNTYSWKNKGDAAIVLAMIEHIEESFPRCRITLSGYDPDDAGLYGDYPFTKSLISLMRHRYGGGRVRFALAGLYLRAALAFFRFGYLFGMRPYRIFPPEMREKIRSYESVDLVIACGGGYLLGREPSRLERLLDSRDLHLLCLDFSLASIFGKPYMLYNQSVGPFGDRRNAAIVTRHLAAARAVLCRESLTFDRLRRLGLENLVEAADIAFHLEAGPCDLLDLPGFDGTKRNVGLTVRKCLPPGQQESFESRLSRFVEMQLAGDPDSRFYIMPQVVFEKAGDNDLHPARRLREGVKPSLRERVFVVEGDLHPACLKYLVGRMDLFVGTRMHSNIFALSSGVKTIALSYEPKTDGIMKMLGLSDYVLKVDEASAEKLSELLGALERDSKYLETLEENLPAVLRLGKQDLRLLAGEDASDEK